MNRLVLYNFIIFRRDNKIRLFHFNVSLLLLFIVCYFYCLGRRNHKGCYTTGLYQTDAAIRAHFATQPDSASLESLAMLADLALASENDVDKVKCKYLIDTGAAVSALPKSCANRICGR